jgi:glycosyltransferase involved in cell wall biosynthesis
VRILHISSGKTFGETERHLVDLARELERRGHEIFIALRPTSEWNDAVAFLPAERILHVSIRNSFGMFSARRIARFVDSRGIEIVHAHGAKDYLAGSIARGAARDVRFVLTRHVARPLKPFHRFALRSVDAAIGLSADAADQLRLTFGGEKIFSVMPGFQMEAGRPSNSDARRRAFRERHEIPLTAPLAVTIGDLSPAGGQRDLVLAAGEVVKHVADVFFVIAGKDATADSRYRRELRRLVKVLGLEGRFVWLEEPADVLELVAAADVLVSPSHLERLTRPLIEAMAAAVPVVATVSGDLLPGRCFVPPHEPVKLAKRIVETLADRAVSDRIASRLQAAVRERFSVARMTDQVEAVYRKVLDRRRLP